MQNDEMEHLSPGYLRGGVTGPVNQSAWAAITNTMDCGYWLDIYCLTALEAESLRSRCEQSQCFLRPPSLACRQPASRCVLTWSPFCVTGMHDWHPSVCPNMETY